MIDSALEFDLDDRRVNGISPEGGTKKKQLWDQKLKPENTDQ